MFISTILISMLLNFTPDIEQFPKWQRVLQEEVVVEPDKEFDGDMMQLLTNEHNSYKKYEYVEDAERYHMHDYWATRDEMKAKMCGDCEDFAIKSYFNLIEAGVKDEDLMIAIVFLYSTAETHAVLIVKNHYVLDCMNQKIVSVEQFYSNAKLIYGINRKGYFTPTTIPVESN